jgi:hypothetical protein
MSFIHWAHLPWTDKSLSTCSTDACPLVELNYPGQIHLFQHVPMMYVLYTLSSHTLDRYISLNMFHWCMSSRWAHLPSTDTSLSTCSNDVCPLYIELIYPGQINLSQHVPVMDVLYINSSCVFLWSNRKSQTINMASQLFIFLVHISMCCFYISYSYLEIEFITENHIW